MTRCLECGNAPPNESCETCHPVLTPEQIARLKHALVTARESFATHDKRHSFDCGVYNGGRCSCY